MEPTKAASNIRAYCTCVSRLTIVILAYIHRTCASCAAAVVLLLLLILVAPVPAGGSRAIWRSPLADLPEDADDEHAQRSAAHTAALVAAAALTAAATHAIATAAAQLGLPHLRIDRAADLAMKKKKKRESKQEKKRKEISSL